MYQFWHINLIWFQYVFYYNIETCINFETFIAGTFGYEPSSSTDKSTRNNFEQNSKRGVTEWVSDKARQWSGLIKSHRFYNHFLFALSNLAVKYFKLRVLSFLLHSVLAVSMHRLSSKCSLSGNSTKFNDKNSKFILSLFPGTVGA